MNKFASKKYIIKTLLCTLLFSSLTWAYPRSNKRHHSYFLWENTRINLDFGLAIPTGMVFKGLTDKFEIDGTKAPIQNSTNIRLGIPIGYDFQINDKLKIGGETGIIYGFNEVTKIPDFDINFKEKHLYIPLLFTYTEVYQTSFYFAITSLLGYEFDILLASAYEQNEYYPNLPDSLQASKNIKELFSRTLLAGNIISGTRFTFPKGFYAQLTVKLSIEALNRVLGKTNEREFDELAHVINLLRYTNSSFLEIHIGLNIMNWIYPKEGLGKRNR